MNRTSRDPVERGREIPGTQYRFLRVLGEGGQGIVVLAHHAFLDTEVVVKLLHADLSERTDLAIRMREEAKALARIDHPNIVRVVDGGVTTEKRPRPYFVMPRLKGDTLHTLLRRQGDGFPVRTALTIVIELLHGLDVAHNPPHSMVHRDIKPGNIFMWRVTPHETRAALLDFGVAKMLDQVSRKTMGKFVGTQEYASPEQLQGHVTARSDLYNVALVLYELVAGRHPFAHICKTREEYVDAHLHKTPPRLSSLGEIDGAIDEVVASALSKDPDARPRSAHEFARMLKAIRLALDVEHRKTSLRVDPNAMNGKTEEKPLETLWARMGVAQEVNAGERPAAVSGAKHTHTGVAFPPPIAADADPPPTSPVADYNALRSEQVTTPSHPAAPTAPIVNPIAFPNADTRRHAPRPAAGRDARDDARATPPGQNVSRADFVYIGGAMLLGTVLALLVVRAYARRLAAESQQQSNVEKVSTIFSVATDALPEDASMTPSPTLDDPQVASGGPLASASASTTAPPPAPVVGHHVAIAASAAGQRKPKLKRRPGSGLEAPAAASRGPHIDLVP